MDRMSLPSGSKPFTLKEGFVSPDVCDYLKLFFEKNISDLGRPNDSESFAYRTIRFGNIEARKNDQYKTAKRLLNMVRLKALNFLKNEFHVEEIYPEYT